MFPFTYSPTFEFPLSGDVRQGISPVFGYEIEGIPEVEAEVVTTVASYGKQLGKLTEAVLAVADKIGMEGKEVEDLRQIAKDVEAAKLRARDAARERAEKVAARAKKLAKLS